MRHLVLLRGCPGAGKSTFVKENNLEQYTLSADGIRLLFQTPVMTEEGNYAINPKNDGKVWDFLFQLLEERMKRGEFTIVDATHSKTEMISRYKKLAQKYRYRVTVVDFSDIPLETLLKQNKQRPEHKRVPEAVILNIYERMTTERVPNWVGVIKPHEFHEVMQYKPIDLSEWKKIHHIGDIHGCYTVLMEYLNGGLKDDELYIFVGDYLDRGIENAEVLKFLIEIKDKKNVVLLEGNHEHHIWRWANDEEPVSKVFEKETQPQLEAMFYKTVTVDKKQSFIEKIFNKIIGRKPKEEIKVLDVEALNKFKKEVRQLYRKLRQLVYYKYHDKLVVVTHGGVAKIPENFMFMATGQFINGVGDYELDIDYAWEKNESENVIQIHGHRNIFRLPVKASKNSFNLEGQVEKGGHLRVVTLTPEGFETHEIKNNVFKIREGEAPIIDEKELTVEDFVNYLQNHEYILEKKLGDNISSFNFTKKAFQEKIWDDINIRARGLFINTNTKEIVSRSYNKFFNINERFSTKISTLADNLKFPVSVYNKPNGYLGTVGYNSETDELVFTSKSEIDNDFANWFKELFYKTFDLEKVYLIKEYIKSNNVSLVFEVILPEKDPHIIEYPNDKLVLLDIVYRHIVYRKRDYEDVIMFGRTFGVETKQLVHTFDNWTDFYKWYREVTEDWSIEEEGYVIEDTSGFMTKIKLPYYNFWKYMRTLKDTIANKREHLVKGSTLYTPLHNKVFAWMKKQDKDWLRQTDIITIRKKFLSEHKC
jgi:predicted kinase